MDRTALQTHSIGALEQVQPYKPQKWNGSPTPRNGPPSLNNKNIGIKLKTKMVRMAQTRQTDVASVDGVKQSNGFDEEEEGHSNNNSYLMRATRSGCRLSQALSYYDYTCDTGGWSHMKFEHFAQKRIGHIRASR